MPAAIAIIRISGPSAFAAVSALARLPPPRTAQLRTLRAGPMVLDRALVLALPGPATATGEDIVELHLHGGRATVAAVEAALTAIDGLHPADPGEFTLQAFANGRLDLTQVEGLADLLAAETEAQRVAALAVSEGGLRHRIEGWYTRLIAVAAELEALIEFAEDENLDVAFDTVTTAVRALADDVAHTLAEPPAERLRDGVRVVIAGPPNAGKSSLINALVGREVAIVTPIAGTTRDVIEAAVVLDGIPIVLSDTAGLRDAPGDRIEAIGVERARAAIERADIVIALDPATPSDPTVIIVAAKADLGLRPGAAGIAVSAVTGEGVTALRRMIVERARCLLPRAGQLALNARQRGLLEAAMTALSLVNGDPLIVAENLREAMRSLEHIRGSRNPDAMLDSLFARFCIGK